MSMNAQDILNAKDFKIQEVLVPEWSGSVYVRTISSSDLDKYEIANKNPEKTSFDLLAKLVAYSICDEAGKKLFTDSQIESLNEKSPKALNRIAKVALQLNSDLNSEVDEVKKN